MSSGPGGGGGAHQRGWELTKENIQPLPTGRRMACLEGSLPVCTASGFKDQHQYEEHHMAEIRRLENIADANEGDDPLQKWVETIKYLEQHFPTMNPNVKSKHNTLIRRTLQTFYPDDRYKNDRRFAPIVIKAAEISPPNRQIGTLTTFLENGVCDKVSDIYKYLAEKYDREGDSKKASEILRKGIENDAQPRRVLEEMLTCIQKNWADRYAKQLREGGAEEVANRNFAASVPIVGENNEAVSIRRNLQQAAPTNQSRPGFTGPKKNIPIYKERAEVAKSLGENDVRQANLGRPLEAPNFFEPSGRDRENQLEPSRWNKEHVQLTSSVTERLEKLQLYEDADISVSKSNKSEQRGGDSRALQVKKDPASTISPDLEPESLPTTSYATTKPPKESKISDEEIRKLHFAEQEANKRMAPQKYRNYNQDFFKKDKIKYEPLQDNRSMNRVAVNEAQWWQRRTEALAKAEKMLRMQQKIDQLSKESEHLKAEQQKSIEQQQKLMEMWRADQEKIKNLEAQVEDLMTKLTKTTTDNNVKEMMFHREKSALTEENDNLRTRVEGLLQSVELYKAKFDEMKESLEDYKARAEPLLREKMACKTYIAEKGKSCYMETSAFDMSICDPPKTKSSMIDVQVSARNRSGGSMLSASGQSSDGSADASNIASVNYTAAGNSFMPNIDQSIDINKSVSQNFAQPRKVLALVERYSEKESMNITPAAVPPLDFECPPSTFGLNLKKKSSKPFALYESISDSFSQGKKVGTGSYVSGKRTEAFQNLQRLPENMPPLEPLEITSTRHSNENAIPVPLEPKIKDDNCYNDFKMPEVSLRKPSENDWRKSFKPDSENDCRALSKMDSENIPQIPTSDVRRRLSILSKRPLTDDHLSDDEEEYIVRRHQQTGLDLNISNLTTALMLAPKPLINSTPEREKTLRQIASVPFNQDQHQAEILDYQGNVQRMPRYNSILTDPPMNLSTIQETSRENRSRSRSTTSSSSGATMSSTRFGMASASTTQGYSSNNQTRSSSVPRSASRGSHQTYHDDYSSDTNMK